MVFAIICIAVSQILVSAAICKLSKTVRTHSGSIEDLYTYALNYFAVHNTQGGRDA